MELTKLVSKPKLIEVEIDDEKIVEKYGETIKFFTWDKMSIEDIVKISSGTEGSIQDMVDAIKPLILDKNGQPVFKGNVTADKEILMACITKVVQMQGK